jgi:hypothetical protein
MYITTSQTHLVEFVVYLDNKFNESKFTSDSNVQRAMELRLHLA